MVDHKIVESKKTQAESKHNFTLITTSVNDKNVKVVKYGSAVITGASSIWNSPETKTRVYLTTLRISGTPPDVEFYLTDVMSKSEIKTHMDAALTSANHTSSGHFSGLFAKELEDYRLFSSEKSRSAVTLDPDTLFIVAEALSKKTITYLNSNGDEVHPDEVISKKKSEIAPVSNPSQAKSTKPETDKKAATSSGKKSESVNLAEKLTNASKSGKYLRVSKTDEFGNGPRISIPSAGSIYLSTDEPLCHAFYTDGDKKTDHSQGVFNFLKLYFLQTEVPDHVQFATDYLHCLKSGTALPSLSGDSGEVLLSAPVSSNMGPSPKPKKSVAAVAKVTKSSKKEEKKVDENEDAVVKLPSSLPHKKETASEVQSPVFGTSKSRRRA